MRPYEDQIAKNNKCSRKASGLPGFESQHFPTTFSFQVSENKDPECRSASA